MSFKINISEKNGKTYHLETEGKTLIEKQLHDKIKGEEVSPELTGYEFEITGASDKAGFTSVKEVEGIGLKKVLLSYEKGMKKRPRKEGKRKLSKKKPKGLRLRKTVRGKVISEAISQINLKILKQGNKKLEEIFPEQNKSKNSESKDSSLKAETKNASTSKEAPAKEAEKKEQ
ncbi:MAG: 30S ribosomal protein S6e [Nanoarchaeota archaeon]|nr:30S ribosomal protein S6e [Nanoarchaeota archaeon]